MAAEYIVTATSWRDAQGVRHRRGDVVTPPEGEVDRLLRARAITTPEALAEAAATKAQADAALQTEAQAAAAAGASDSGTLEGVVPPALEPNPYGLELPKKAGAAKAWEDYAVALFEKSKGKAGLKREDAEKATKQDLIELFS